MPRPKKPSASTPTRRKKGAKAPAKRVQKESQGTAVRRARARPPRPQTLALPAGRVLVLECDADTLAAQGFSIAGALHRTASVGVSADDVVHVRAKSLGQLLMALGDLRLRRSGFGLIVVVGHSNRNVICLAPDVAVPWATFAAWLAPFSPKHLILIACEAGRWLPARAMFGGLKTLRDIFASPLTITERQAAPFHALVPYLSHAGRLAEGGQDMLRVARAAAFALADGSTIFHHTRREFLRSGVEEGQLWSFAEECLAALRPKLFPR
jgi:hypothetical protein